MAIQTQAFDVPNGDLTLQTYLARPAAMGTYAAILVLPEIFGINAHIRAVTERIARLGYVAIAMPLYQRQAPGFERGYTPTDIDLGRQYKVQTKATELLSDIQATIAAVQQLPQVQPGGVGCIGFCFGGYVAYLAASLQEISAVASFYGAGIPDLVLGEGPPAISYTAAMTGTLYAFFGTEDASIPESALQQIEAALQSAQVTHKIFRYPGAGHGFFCDQRPSYHSEAAAAAWAQVQALFTEKLGQKSWEKPELS